MPETFVREIALRCSPGHAFSVFTGKLDLWWPRGHRRNPDGRLSLDPRPDGALLETAPDGSEWVMGRVILAQSPEKLVFDWFPGSPAAPTRAEIDFIAEHDTTLIRITHSALSDAALAVWPDRVAMFVKGWTSVLAALAAFIEETDAHP